MDWTTAQQQVIDARNGNILVAAAAGSGKTAVLVERIIQMVTKEHKNIDSLLVVTFTNAAAAQMRQKITKALERAQQENPSDEHLIQQLSYIHRAQITTIDSFCLQIVRDHFNLLQIDPNMRILDDAEQALMRADIIDTLLEDEYKKENIALSKFVRSYGNGKSDEFLGELVGRLYNIASSYPRPKEWFQKARREIGIADSKSLQESEWMKRFLIYIRARMESVRHIPSMLQQFVQVETQVPDKYRAFFAREITFMDTLYSSDSYDIIASAMNAECGVTSFQFRFTKLTRGKEEWTAYNNARKAIKEYFKYSSTLIVQQMQAVAPMLEGLLTLTEQFLERYQQSKQKKNGMDFGDIEHMALQVLSTKKDDGTIEPSAIAKSISAKYEEILIDEYQDSNYLQEEILTSVSHNYLGEAHNNVFMVGDVKQSIYRFRMARPDLFQSKYATYEPLEGASYRKIDLNQNFRSRETVLESVNALFYQVMHTTIGGIEYSDAVSLVPGRKYETYEGIAGHIAEKTEVHILEMDGAGKDKEQEDETADVIDTEELSKMEAEAKMVAMRIQKMMNSDNPFMIFDDSVGYRPVSYRDIVILFRSLKGCSDVFTEVLMNAGIPVYTENRNGYFDSIEVKTVLSLLAVVDNTRDDIHVAAVLHSPLVGLSNEELAMIRIGSKRESMMTSVRKYEGNVSIRSRLDAFEKMVETLREAKAYSSIRELIWMALDMTGYYNYIYAMPGGKKRQANILKLMDKAQAYESTGYKGVFHFLQYIKNLKIKNQDFGEATVLGPSDNLVRIMSIHKSKGLEFPVVFLSGCGKNMNRKDGKGNILMNSDCYLASYIIDLEQRVRQKTLNYEAIKAISWMEGLAEELRILYVAMTRAQEQLIITGTVNEYDKLAEKLGDLKENQDVKAISTDKLLESKSYIDWFVMNYLHSPQVGNNEDEREWYQYYFWKLEDLRQVQIQEFVEMGKSLDFLHQEELQEENPDLHKELEEKYTWQYPYEELVHRGVKLSVTELKKMEQLQEEKTELLYPQLEEVNENMNKAITEETGEMEHTLPQFMQQEHQIGGAQRGTAMHKVMELLDWKLTQDKDQIKQQISELKQRGILQEAEEQSISYDEIYKMVTSTLGQRMKKAYEKDQLYREQQFVIGIPMKEVFSDSSSDELELIQGIIDAYFIEEDEIVIVDYKTDHVGKDIQHASEELIKRYKVQLDYYARTVEQLTRKKVKACYIYAFTPNCSIEIPKN